MVGMTETEIMGSRMKIRIRVRAARNSPANERGVGIVGGESKKGIQGSAGEWS